MKQISEIVKDSVKNLKSANYTIIVDFDTFNLFYCIINNSLIIKLIYHQYEKSIKINQYAIEKVENDTLVKLNNLTYSHQNSYVPSKQKAMFILRVLQKNIAKSNNKNRFEINKQINYFINNRL
jgi:hypothetical protein